MTLGSQEYLLKEASKVPVASGTPPVLNANVNLRSNTLAQNLALVPAAGASEVAVNTDTGDLTLLLGGQPNGVRIVTNNIISRDFETDGDADFSADPPALFYYVTGSFGGNLNITLDLPVNGSPGGEARLGARCIVSNDSTSVLSYYGNLTSLNILPGTYVALEYVLGAGFNYDWCPIDFRGALNNGVGSGTDVALTSGTAAAVRIADNSASYNLAAGVWEVSGSCTFTPAASTTATLMEAGFNTSAALPAIDYCASISGSLTGTNPTVLNLAPQIITLNAPGQIFLAAKSTFAVSTMAARGRFVAKQVG